MKEGQRQIRQAVMAACLLFAAGPLIAEESVRIVFLTSVAGTGDLSSWDDAGDATGIAAGDAICRARAAAGGLANADRFVAWLSDSTEDAYCRVQGYAARKQHLCGQETLPAEAGSWARTDGFPFGGHVDMITHPTYRVFAPVRFDEFGNRAEEVYMMTGTDGRGERGSIIGPPPQCGDWTDESFPVLLGGSIDVGEGWTTGWLGSCSAKSRLLCMETEKGLVLKPEGVVGRTAFVSSVSNNGNLADWPEVDAGLTGVDAGDSICRNLAADAGLGWPESFKAWLSVSGTNAIDRFENDGLWVRLDGTPVAYDKADLAAANLFTAINVTEHSQHLRASVGMHAWTGSDNFGFETGFDCNGWSDDSPKQVGTAGMLRSAGARWSTSGSPRPCDQAHHLYCLSDMQVVVHADGFEAE